MSSGIKFQINAAGQSITPCKHNPHYCVGGWWCINKCPRCVSRIIREMEVNCSGSGITGVDPVVKESANNYFWETGCGRISDKDNFVLTSMPEFLLERTVDLFRIGLHELLKNPNQEIDEEFLNRCTEIMELVQGINKDVPRKNNK